MFKLKDKKIYIIYPDLCLSINKKFGLPILVGILFFVWYIFDWYTILQL